MNCGNCGVSYLPEDTECRGCGRDLHKMNDHTKGIELAANFLMSNAGNYCSCKDEHTGLMCDKHAQTYCANLIEEHFKVNYTDHMLQLYAEIDALKSKLEVAVKEISEIEESYRWYDTRGTEQEKHHFLNVEVRSYLVDLLEKIRVTNE